MYRHRHRGERPRPRLAASEINLWNQSAVDLQSLRKVLTTSERERDELAWTVPVRNDTASQVGIGTTLALGPVIMPLALDDTVDLAFSAVDVASNNDIPCVLVEPIRPGFIGRAVVSGVTKALIDGTSFATQRFARPMVGTCLSQRPRDRFDCLINQAQVSTWCQSCWDLVAAAAVRLSCFDSLSQRILQQYRYLLHQRPLPMALSSTS